MELPSSLGAWTFETVRALVVLSQYEPGPYDFKAALKAGGGGSHGADLANSIRRTACGMANADGGFIVFGVADASTQSGDPAARIIGISDAKELRKEFGDKISCLQPEVHFEASPEPIEVPGKPGHFVIVVNVPRSARRPHMFEGVFYKRVAAGKVERMDVHEVREQMLNTAERIRKLELLRSEIAFISQICDELSEVRDENLRVVRFDVSGIKPLMAETCALYPDDKKLEEALLKLTLAANRTNAFMHQVLSWATEGHGLSDQLVHSWREQANGGLREIKALCHTCGPAVRAILDDLRGA